MCVNLVTVHYQPEGGSLMMYTVGNTTAVTGATLSNLQCDTEYTIWVEARSGQLAKESVFRLCFLPTRGSNYITLIYTCYVHVL